VKKSPLRNNVQLNISSAVDLRRRLTNFKTLVSQSV